jgi:predicted PurR-regulated permease PerM
VQAGQGTVISEEPSQGTNLSRYAIVFFIVCFLLVGYALFLQGRTNRHPLLVFFGVLGGLQVFGFPGILLGPLTITVFLSFLNFYRLEFGHDLKKE